MPSRRGYPCRGGSERSVGLGRLVCELTSLFEKLLFLRFVFTVERWFLHLLVRALLLSDDPAFRVRVGATVAGTIGSGFEIGAVSNRSLCSITCVIRPLFSDLKLMRPCDTLVALCRFLFYRQACVLPF